jgi:type IV secretion system protein VirD4
MWGTNGGIYFGRAADRTQGDHPNRSAEQIRYVGDRHLMTLGPNGSGKSRRVILPNIAMLKDWSIVVVDPKGTLARMTLPDRPGAIMLNPFDSFGLSSSGHNPVAALDHSSEDFPDDALGLAEAMIRIEGREPHWAASAQDLVTALIMYSRLTQSDGGTLGHVRECLGRTYADFRETITNMIAVAEKRDCPELAIKAGRYAEISDESRELNSILSTALTQTRWLDSRPIKRDLAKSSTIDFGKLKREPTIVYLTLPARRLGTHSTWLRVIIASIVQPLMKDTTKSKVPVLLILDEYPALADGGFAIIEKNMAMFREYGIKLWTVWQDLSQAEKLYGKGWESFVANAGVLQSFAPQDVKTADYLSQRMPLTAMSTEAINRSLGGMMNDKSPASHSSNTSLQGMPLMLPQHLRSMDEGYSVIYSHKAKNPIRSYFPYHLPGLEHVYKRDPSG